MDLHTDKEGAKVNPPIILPLSWRLAMDPIQVTVDHDGMVTVTIVDSDGQPATWQLRFEDAEALQAKLISRLNAFRNRSGWR